MNCELIAAGEKINRLESRIKKLREMGEYYSGDAFNWDDVEKSFCVISSRDFTKITNRLGKKVLCGGKRAREAIKADDEMEGK